MKHKRLSFFISFLMLSVICLSSCENADIPLYETSTSDISEIISQIETGEMDFSYSDRDQNSDYDAESATLICFSDSGSTVTGNGASASGTDVTITAAGTYLLTGTASDAVLTVSASKTDKIQLVLNGLSLSCTDGPAVYIQSADKVFITLAENSENFLSDGNSYEITDDGSTLDAALFSKEDLTINGTGKLTVIGNYKHGIVSKDDLVVTGGILSITSVKVGLCGKDCVKINAGEITIDAGSDGIRSDNDEDTSCGYVYISGGTLHITAGNDGIQAETVLNIESGNIDMTTGGGSANASTTTGGAWNPGWGNWGGNRPGDFGNSSETTVDEESAKGLKAGTDLVITGGNFNIDSSDDSIHCNGNIAVTDGVFSLLSGDDGVHADTTLAVSDGIFDIEKSYEGMEATDIVISGGTIHITASDDGVNAAGGNDSSSLGGRPGQGMFTGSTGTITISGGYLVVYASGDGIDSNGSLTITGGITLVAGPTDGANGALDYESSATVTGGILIALGSSGMAQGFSSAENQGAILCSFSTQQAGNFCICNADGTVVASFTTSKSYSSAVITAPDILSGNSYTLYWNAEIEGADENGFAQNTTKSGGTVITQITMTSELYGSSGGGWNPGGMGGRPGK